MKIGIRFRMESILQLYRWCVPRRYVKSNSDNSKGLSIEPVLEIVDISGRKQTMVFENGVLGKILPKKNEEGRGIETSLMICKPTAHTHTHTHTQLSIAANTTVKLNNITTCSNNWIWRGMFRLRVVPAFSEVVFTFLSSIIALTENGNY